MSDEGWRRGDEAAWWDGGLRRWRTGTLTARHTVPSFVYDVKMDDGTSVAIPERLLRSIEDPGVRLDAPPPRAQGRGTPRRPGPERLWQTGRNGERVKPLAAGKARHMTAPASDVDAVLRPFALGLATGARTTAGITGVALTGGGAGPVSRALSSTWARRVIPVLCAGELVGDKLPKTPSRLDGPGFPARMVTSTLSGVAIAERDNADQIATAAFTVAGASLGAVLGSALRSAAKRRGWSDLPIALAEDLLAAALTFIGVAAARDHS